MRAENKGLGWRLGYGVFCLLYVAWVVYLGLDNFDKVHGEYRQALVQVQPGQAERIARQELGDECRRAAKRSVRSPPAGDRDPGVTDDPCRSFPKAVLAERQKVVAQHLQAEKKRFQRKVVVFYVTFAVFFIVLPLVCLYLLLSFLIWVFRDLKFIK